MHSLSPVPSTITSYSSSIAGCLARWLPAASVAAAGERGAGAVTRRGREVE
uniref:Uncharacterized protein n=1 Tax=Arundo donax TaxID=35708 RepID=A0A0A8Y229_ARUDO